MKSIVALIAVVVQLTMLVYVGATFGINAGLCVVAAIFCNAIQIAMKE